MNHTTADAASTSKHPTRVKILWAAILGFFIPGLGQIYAKSWKRGIILLSVFIIYAVISGIFVHFLSPSLFSFTILIILLVVQLAFAVWSAFDAAKQARVDRSSLKTPWHKSTWLAFASYLLIACIINAALPCTWGAYFIPSASNVPTLLIGDLINTQKINASTPLQRGDIIVFRPPGEPGSTFIKRLIGLPGDQVQIISGILYLNQQPVTRTALGIYNYRDHETNVTAQEYLETLSPEKRYNILKTTDTGFANNTPLYTIPPGDVFVLGDNRDDSLDPRFMNGPVGYIPEANIIGKAELIYWPPSRFQLIK